MTKYRARVMLPGEAMRGTFLYSEPMTKNEAYEICKVITSAVQVAAIDVVKPRGYVVEEGVPTRKARN